MQPPRERSFGRDDAIDFLDARRDRGPRELLLEALALGGTPPRIGGGRPLAADLGCGPGHDAVELACRGFEVLATDLHEECLAETRRRAEIAGVLPWVRLEQVDFESLELPEERLTLVHAGFSLPFCGADLFPRVWRGIVRALRPGGLLVGQIFGNREPMVLDAPPGSAVGLDAEALRRLIDGVEPDERLEILKLEEVDRPGRDARGRSKHWHVFHAILRRPDH